VYEPGSTFKLITAAALLQTNRVRSFDIFDGEKGRADMEVAVISDAHPFEDLTFREGFIHSSNIVMAKASLNLKPLEFMKFVRLFGFGSKTGIELLGESPGQVTPVDEWSKRTQITMAFGQEIAVTPLQIVNAFATVANDGVLVMPRIVRAIVDENTGETETFESVEVRRVISEETSERLREYCRAAVAEGTGSEANLTFIDVGGKTGTAQKASRRGGYHHRKCVASFAGFVPADDPEVACLVILDEPNFANRFGGLSAAPVFARITEAIASSSHVFDDVLATTHVETDVTDGRTFEAPNFLRLSREAAMERARMFDLNLLCRGGEGEVIAQDPDPGVAIGRDDVLRVYLSGDRSRAKGEKAPDLRGMPIRQARRRAAEAGFRCDVVGSGLVASQKPVPGGVSKDGVIKIRCKDSAMKQKTG
jgi:membrane peptidoglycan carboxypeptidase